jgi:hypothetical protein
MKPMTKAVSVALIQILIVCSLGAKLLYDRQTRPQAWFKTERFDPNLPIRGRYVSLQIEVADPLSPEEVESKFKNEIENYEKQPYHSFYQFGFECGSIELRGQTPTGRFDDSPGGRWSCDNLSFSRRRTGDKTVLQLNAPILFFISDTAKDPTSLQRGEELWVLATIPRKGPPRPVALGIKKSAETAITPLNLN